MNFIGTDMPRINRHSCSRTNSKRDRGDRRIRTRGEQMDIGSNLIGQEEGGRDGIKKRDGKASSIK